MRLGARCCPQTAVTLNHKRRAGFISFSDYTCICAYCVCVCEFTKMVKNPPAMWETCVQSLGWEDLLEEGMATHSSILAWRIPMNRRAW